MANENALAKRATSGAVRGHVGAARADAEMLNLFALSAGDCLRLPGLCEFRSCRYRVPGGGCALKMAEREGPRQLPEVATLLGFTKQGIDQIVQRAAVKIRRKLADWEGHEMISVNTWRIV